MEGLLLDHDGYLRIKPDDLTLVLGIADRLPGDYKDRLFLDLTSRAQDATLSYAFKDEAQVAALKALQTLAHEREGTALGQALDAVASRIIELRTPPPQL